MANLVQHNEPSLVSLAISAAPCGHCRQFYSELACAVSDATPSHLCSVGHMGSLLVYAVAWEPVHANGVARSA